jgi:hypothetical protein
MRQLMRETVPAEGHIASTAADLASQVGARCHTEPHSRNIDP